MPLFFYEDGHKNWGLAVEYLTLAHSLRPDASVADYARANELAAKCMLLYSREEWGMIRDTFLSSEGGPPAVFNLLMQLKDGILEITHGAIIEKEQLRHEHFLWHHPRKEPANDPPGV